jgi:anti-anti-sigma factor
MDTPGDLNKHGIEIHITDEGEAVCTCPEEFDLLYAEPVYASVKEAIMQAHVKGLIINLGRTSFMDGSGVTTLLRSKEEAMKAGKEFSVRNAGRLPRRIFEITSMMEILNVEPLSNPHLEH